VPKTLCSAGRSRIHPVYVCTIPENGTLISDGEFNKIIHLDDNFLYNNIKYVENYVQSIITPITIFSIYIIQKQEILNLPILGDWQPDFSSWVRVNHLKMRVMYILNLKATYTSSTSSTTHSKLL